MSDDTDSMAIAYLRKLVGNQKEKLEQQQRRIVHLDSSLVVALQRITDLERRMDEASKCFKDLKKEVSK